MDDRARGGLLQLPPDSAKQLIASLGSVPIADTSNIALSAAAQLPHAAGATRGEADKSAEIGDGEGDESRGEDEAAAWLHAERAEYHLQVGAESGHSELGYRDNVVLVLCPRFYFFPVLHRALLREGTLARCGAALDTLSKRSRRAAESTLR
jgi:hypothetical protein